MQSDDKCRWFYSFKCAFKAEKYLMCITNKWLRGMYARFRLRAFGLKSHKQWVTTEQQGDFTCPMCGQEREDGDTLCFSLPGLYRPAKELQHA